jgi:dihydropyrimidinase
MRVTGWPILTLSRGEVVCRDGTPIAKAGRGQFLHCDPPEPAMARGPSVLDRAPA